jgi:hypothetical protein
MESMMRVWTLKPDAQLPWLTLALYGAAKWFTNLGSRYARTVGALDERTIMMAAVGETVSVTAPAQHNVAPALALVSPGERVTISRRSCGAE